MSTLAVDPADNALHETLKEHIEELLETLSEREYQVLHLRYGLDNDRRRTLQEAGEELGVTREAVERTIGGSRPGDNGTCLGLVVAVPIPPGETSRCPLSRDTKKHPPRGKTEP